MHPLLADRIAALVEPATRDAHAGRGESSPAFRQLESEIQRFTENPVGVGLDVPNWLRKLELEVERARRGLEVPARPSPANPRLTFEDLREQITKWELPLA